MQLREAGDLSEVSLEGQGCAGHQVDTEQTIPVSVHTDFLEGSSAPQHTS